MNALLLRWLNEQRKQVHESEAMILRYSSSVNAFRVCVVMLP